MLTYKSPSSSEPSKSRSGGGELAQLEPQHSVQAIEQGRPYFRHVHFLFIHSFVQLASVVGLSVWVDTCHLRSANPNLLEI